MNDDVEQVTCPVCGKLIEVVLCWEEADYSVASSAAGRAASPSRTPRASSIAPSNNARRSWTRRSHSMATSRLTTAHFRFAPASPIDTVVVTDTKGNSQ